MFKSAYTVLPLVRNITACGFLTVALAACGSGSNGSASGVIPSAANSSGTQSLVSPGTGSIDRSGTTTGDTAGTVASTVVTTSPPPAAPSSPPVAPSPPPAAPSPTTGAATLDWTAPTENTDGSALTNLAGYTVYYGTSPTNLTQTVKINNPGLTAYTMTDLPAGTWYFAITAYSASGSESTRSGVVSTKI